METDQDAEIPESFVNDNDNYLGEDVNTVKGKFKVHFIDFPNNLPFTISRSVNL